MVYGEYSKKNEKGEFHMISSILPRLPLLFRAQQHKRERQKNIQIENILDGMDAIQSMCFVYSSYKAMSFELRLPIKKIKIIILKGRKILFFILTTK